MEEMAEASIGELAGMRPGEMEDVEATKDTIEAERKRTPYESRKSHPCS
jgi:hypothetical protein